MCKDSDNDPLTFTLLDGAPSNDSIASAATAPTYTFLPGPGDTGTFYPKIVVTDSKNGFDTLTITLNIHAQSVSSKALTAFSFTSPAVTAAINESAKTVALTVPYGTDVTALVATFVSTGASVKVGTTVQTSGTTPNNFTGPVTYTVIGSDGSTQAYVVTVTVASNAAKALTAFSFSSPAVTGTISESAKTVALTVPYGTDVTALVATFAVSSGASVKVGSIAQTSGTTSNNFSSPVTYMVVAADGSTQAYVVTVTTASNTAKVLTTFSFSSPSVTAAINETEKTVALTVPFGTDVTALIATFASTGASVKVGTVAQTSGTTPNNFTSPVTYTVIAADGSTQAYVATVTIGQNAAKALTSFSFASPAATGTITESSKTVTVSVPFGTDVTALVATFVSTGASVKVGAVVQTSGTTPNNFTSPITYTVVAGDGSTQAYVVTVTIGANAAIIIATQPQDQTKCIGSPVSFSVAASTAVGTLSYQWKNASGNLTEGHFTGTTTNSLSISAVAAGDAGTYSCSITSTGGGSPVTSSGAKLTVNTLSTTPTLAANVTSVCPPGSVIFTITGTLGTGANWQVYAGGTKLTAQPTIASNSFTISNISAATSYSVKAEGGTCDNASSPPTSNSVAIALTSYSVTFNCNGGTPVPSVQTITCNSIATTPTQSPTKTGYDFVGWYIDTSSSSAFNFSAPITGAITLNAKWSKKIYTVTFDRNGGNVDANPTSETAVYQGNVGSLPAPPTRIGYIFADWNTAQNGIGGTTFTASTAVTASITIYAQWTKVYTVAYNGNGSSGSAPQDPNTYTSGATVTVLANSNLVQNGYTFIGWKDKAGLVDTNTKTFKMPSANDTLFAQWDVRDADGNHYDTIVLGGQTWMKQNLMTTKFNNGTAIPHVNGSAWSSIGTPAYCWYNDSIKYKNNYGALYNFYAGDTKILAPKGWHVPTPDECTALSNYVGTFGNSLSDFATFFGGFVVPDNGFNFLNNVGYWWSSTNATSFDNYMCQCIAVNSTDNPYNGYSVRCIRGDPQ
jgi:uncharacterized protein (TIGR02145 family)/uncharacterized repeat protein (TIGR02543 family)